MNIFKKSILISAFIFTALNFFILTALSNMINYPLTVIDDTATAVTIFQKPQRIISTAPSNTEILFDLGLHEKIVGITN
ncbi:MAG: cobalamin-binding protein, partial [Candidatus Bathyarchaeota archaeon]|nr:cobalamin-binding protein [Candidatus Bathyarchaeota archaeon]